MRRRALLALVAAVGLTAPLDAAILAAARIDSALFTSLVFDYSNAGFHRAWHRAWNAPAAHVVQWSPIEHGKTQQATGWAAHRLGTDPKNTRILWVGSAQTAALKSIGVVKALIEAPPPPLAAVFPTLRPGRKWTDAQFSVAGASITEKDHSVEAAGVGGAILGGRFTDIVLDDTCTFQTTYTAERRQQMTRWVLSTVLGRLLEGGRILVLGNAWYPDDLMHVLAERGFTVIRDEAYRETAGGEIDPTSILWPAQWSSDRLAGARRELGTVEAFRQLRCKPYSAGQGRFDLAWFDRAMDAGRGLTLVDEYRGPWPTFAGLDLGIGQKEKHDRTAGWAMAVDPATNRRLVLNAFEERIKGAAVVERMRDWQARYGAVWTVENNAAQDFLRQWAAAAGVPTRPFTTGKQKASPEFGVPSLGVELEQGLWVLPCGDERSKELMVRWRTQCLDWTPGEHTGDLLMASWFAREGARLGTGNAAATAEPPGVVRAAYGQLRARYGARR